jgi:Uncharacterised nucleotidyltransferase
MVAPTLAAPPGAAPEIYRRAIRALRTAEVPFLVGGAYALAVHAGVERHTKDIDVFLRPADLEPALAALGRAGFRPEVTYPHWLAKAFLDGHFIDLIFNLGNGSAPVDDGWFRHALAAEVLGEPIWLVPAEEMLWSKAIVMDRERYDGADVAHLLRANAARLDWPRLLWRFGPHWRVLLSHLVLFGFIYPAERQLIPEWVLRGLTERLLGETAAAPPGERLCQGTLLSRSQYLVDVECWGYQDARLVPRGALDPDQMVRWHEEARAAVAPPDAAGTGEGPHDGEG